MGSTVSPQWGAWSGLLAAFLLYCGWSPEGDNELILLGDIKDSEAKAELSSCMYVSSVTQ